MFFYSFLFFCGFQLLLVVQAQESRYTYGEDLYNGPYKHIYPPVDITRDQKSCQPSENSTCPLYLAVMFSFGGSFRSSGAIPGVQLALDQMNDDPGFLPGYTLHYLMMDSQCKRSLALQAFHTHVMQSPTKIGVLGSGCSVASEATAELAPFYNLTQISCASGSNELSKRLKFPSYFRISVSAIHRADGYFGIVKEFGWKRVAIITQDENLFTETMGRLKQLLQDLNITYNERRFETEDGVDSLDPPFDPNSRIFILSMYPPHARILLCKAHQQGLKYPRALLLLEGWYAKNWWVGSKKEQEELMNKYDCTLEQRKKVLFHFLAVRQAGTTFTDASAVADSGINGSKIETLYDMYRTSSNFNLTYLDYYQTCYDATWTIGRALNRTLSVLQSNETLAAEMASYDENFSGGDFSLQHFTYNNSKFLDLVFNQLESTDFRGIVGPIKFDQNGERIVNKVDVFQYQSNTGNNEETLVFIRIAEIIKGAESEMNTTLQFISQSRERVFPSGVPLDGIPCEVEVSILPGVSILFMILAIIGIILSLVGIILHFYYREKKIVRLSSPNLNLLVGIGAIILYMDIIITVIPTTSKVVNTILCNLTPWMTALGYSLCYGTILVKMGRVFYIFDNPTKKKKKFLKDKVLFLGVGILVAIDLIILTVYTAVEGAKGNLEANRVPHTENPQDIVGELQKITNYFIYVCHNRSRAITLGILYGYKMLLQIVALVLSFSIRKVKIKGLNDAKYIAAAVYITSIVTAVIIVITYTLDTRINIFAAIFSTGFFIGTTAILGLVMIPPLIGYFRDPEGKTVFQNSASHNADNAISTYGNKTAKNTNTADVMSIEDGLKQEVSENGVNIRDEQK